jgi:hypothetical protein
MWMGMTARLRIVLACSTAHYPEGGGNLSWFLPYLFGAHALGHDVYVLDPLPLPADRIDQPNWRTELHLRRFAFYGFRGRCAILQMPRRRDMDFDTGAVFGMEKERLREVIQSADLVLNFCFTLRQPLLSMFRHRALLDLDPGIVQIPLEEAGGGMDVYEHQSFFTVGTKMHDTDCKVPTLGLTWNRHLPPVYLPLWRAAPDPGPAAPFSTVTQWTRRKMYVDGEPLSKNKRDAYLRFVSLPQRTGRSFELAANIPREDTDDDRGLLRRHGWNIVDPHQVAKSPAAYRKYIKRSRAEISCAKPAYRELNTGWFSDRSACYLASGRPVLAEDTGFSDYLPTGRGLLVFRDMEQAVEGAAAIDADYAQHARAARELAEEHLDARRWVDFILRASGC